MAQKMPWVSPGLVRNPQGNVVKSPTVNNPPVNNGVIRPVARPTPTPGQATTMPIGKIQPIPKTPMRPPVAMPARAPNPTLNAQPVSGSYNPFDTVAPGEAQQPFRGPSSPMHPLAGNGEFIPHSELSDWGGMRDALMKIFGNLSNVKPI